MFKFLYIVTSYEALVASSLFLTFECTNPYVEKILTTPAKDATAVCSCTATFKSDTEISLSRLFHHVKAENSLLTLGLKNWLTDSIDMPSSRY